MSENLLSWANIPGCPDCEYTSWIRKETVDAVERQYVLDTNLVWRHIDSTGGMSDSSYRCQNCEKYLEDQEAISFLRALEKSNGPDCMWEVVAVRGDPVRASVEMKQLLEEATRTAAENAEEPEETEQAEEDSWPGSR